MTKPRQIAGQNYTQRSRGRAGGIASLASLFVDGSDGFLFDNMGDLSRLFVGSLGPLNVAADNDQTGLALDNSKWNGKTLSQQLASQSELIGGAWTMSVTGGTATATEAPAGQLNLTGDGTNTGIGRNTFSTIVGQSYLIDAMISSSAAGLSVGTSLGGGQYINGMVLAVGANRASFIATATTAYVQFAKTSAQLAVVAAISGKAIAGNHVLQASSTQRPVWKEATDPWLLFDGTDDRLVSNGLMTNSAMTLAIAIRAGAGDAVNAQNPLAGGQSTGNLRLYLGINATGKPNYGWGDISGANLGPSDIRGIDSVLVLVGNGTSVKMWLDGVLIRNDVSTVVPNGTGQPFSLGAYNNGAGFVTFFSGRLYAALAIKRAVTDAEVANITTQFQRTFQ